MICFRQICMKLLARQFSWEYLSASTGSFFHTRTQKVWNEESKCALTSRMAYHFPTHLFAFSGSNLTLEVAATNHILPSLRRNLTVTASWRFSLAGFSLPLAFKSTGGDKKEVQIEHLSTATGAATVFRAFPNNVLEEEHVTCRSVFNFL